MTESKIPELSEGVDKARESVKQLCWWLPNPHKCPECNVYCDATTTYDPDLVEYVDSWECPECNQAFYRERV